MTPQNSCVKKKSMIASYMRDISPHVMEKNLPPLSSTNVSVIIPTLNEEGFIEKLLSDILKQKGYNEIIVSDSGSTDKTQNIVEQFARDYPDSQIIFTRAEKKGVSMARNTGARQSTGNYLVFLDADNRLPENFFLNIIREMQERKLDVAACPLVPDSKKLADQGLFFFQRIIANTLQYSKKPASGGACIVAKKETHDKISGFNQDMKYNEDLYYLQKARKNGRFRMLQSTRVYISVRRFEQEGRVKLFSKYIFTGFLYLLGINFKRFEYEFGKFSKSKRP